MQSALKSGQEARIVQIDFSAVFNRVNSHGIQYKLCSEGVGGSVLSIYIDTVFIKSTTARYGGRSRSKLDNIVSGLPKGSALGSLLFLLYTSELFSILKKKLIGYADESTLIAVLPSPGVRVTVPESLSRDLVVSEWCDLRGMKLNASKTKIIIVSRSRTIHPQSPALTFGGTVLKQSDDLVTLGVTFVSKMKFEKHLRAVSRAASQRLGILRKSWQVFHDRLLLGRCFKGFALPVLEYCSTVWCQAAYTHLKLLDRVVSGDSFLTGVIFECDHAHRRSVAVLSMLYKIKCNPMHPLYGALPCRMYRCVLHAAL